MKQSIKDVKRIAELEYEVKQLKERLAANEKHTSACVKLWQDTLAEYKDRLNAALSADGIGRLLKVEQEKSNHYQRLYRELLQRLGDHIEHLPYNVVFKEHYREK